MTTTVDPTLDQDVADWFATTVTGTTQPPRPGQRPRAGNRADPPKAYYSELLAFLALRGGVDVDEICVALGVRPTKLRGDISTLRTRLGPDLQTGEPHLPPRGANGYRTGERVLVDLDLFKRLRVRGQARGGAQGQRDLITALELVTGRPFDQQRHGGWSWLFEGERHDEYMTAAIADVALAVTNGSLDNGDPGRARTAADISALAAPHEEATRLCLVCLEEALPRALAEHDEARVETVASRRVEGKGRAVKTVTLERRDGWYVLVLAVCLASCGYLVVRGTGAIADGSALPVDLVHRIELVTKAGWLTVIFSAFVGLVAAALLIGDEHAITDDR